ncbi:MAG: tRNA (adenosine(37)-N6)-threonylcarbamoyltransferase complex dimerization subunit type 1 TsaB [Anaerolineae bacterium]|nr:tRNA (adenosine(37)-N6)-threonylcarbamoyltransferase complex dimerization subunit type 1 TsaB [Anaerolineae bacterium]
MGTENHSILAIDTATRNISLALLTDHEIAAETTWRTSENHTIELAPAVDVLLKRAAVTPVDLQAIAVTLGPGSFTGLRIGMGFAKGLALASEEKIALIGISTLDVVAAGQPHPDGVDRLCAVVQAGRGRVSAGFYIWQHNRWTATEEEPFIADWDTLSGRLSGPVLAGGEIDQAGREQLAGPDSQVIVSSAAQSLRRAGFLALLAQERLSAGRIDDPATLAPIYLR